MRQITVLLALCLAALVSACAGNTARPGEATADCGRPADAGTNTRLSMIRKLFDGGHPHAALAHLDAAALKGPAADQLRADILRRVGRTEEARLLYQGLLGSCLAGAGHHGLGLLAGQEGRQAESLAQLRQARLALPADARVRSDLGYALMLAGELEAASFEFLTALDLDPEERKAAPNLIVLLFRQGSPDKAAAVALRYRIDKEELARLRQEAATVAPAAAPGQGGKP